MDIVLRTSESLLAIFHCLLCIDRIQATIDPDKGYLQFVASHLTDDECSKLTSALQSEAFEWNYKRHPYLGLDSSENRFTCLDHLLHWNSGEGRARSQQDMAHRLIQIGRPDLANWLTTAVFKDFVDDLVEALKLNENIIPDSDGICDRSHPPPDVEVPIVRLPWKIHHTMLVVALASTLIYLTVISFRAVKKAYSYQMWATKRPRDMLVVE